MSKQQLIEMIRTINPAARLEFLATFREADLMAYLKQLESATRNQNGSRRRCVQPLAPEPC